MSWAGITWAYSIEGLSIADKAVLLYLGYRMQDATLKSWPKRKLISEATELAMRTVTRSLAKLQEKKLITLVESKKYHQVFKIEPSHTGYQDWTLRLPL